MTDENRIQTLEEMIAHQEQQIADLSEMLILQGREIAKLDTQLKRLKAKIELHEAERTDSGEDAPISATEFAAQNKPPHY